MDPAAAAEGVAEIEYNSFWYRNLNISKLISVINYILEIYEEFNCLLGIIQPSMSLCQHYQKIIIIILKFSHKILEIDMATYFGSISLS